MYYMMVKLKRKPKNKKNEYEGKIDKMKLPLLPHGTIRAAANSLCTLSAIKHFTLLCVIKRVFLLVALQSKALPARLNMNAVRRKYQLSNLFMLDKNFHLHDSE